MAVAYLGRTVRITISLTLAVLVALNIRILLNRLPAIPEEQLDMPLASHLVQPEHCTESRVEAYFFFIDLTWQKTFNASGLWKMWSEMDPAHVKALGHVRKEKGFLTVGVPSIKRINGMTYLIQTINSLIETTSTVEKTRVVVIVFLADFDTEYNDEVARALLEKYVDYINVGFLQVVQATKNYYPKLNDLKQNFKDAAERVTWRAKQVADFAFMFLYARNISEYYVQIEDDVICAKDFVSSIRSYIEEMQRNNKPWAVLEFSELGFIGKLVKASDLPKLAQYLMTFYEEQPVDWLATYFRLSMAQKQVYLRKPTLFQHIGLKSSFDTSHDNRLKDRFFDAGLSKWKSDDPSGFIVSDMEHYKDFTAELIYAAADSYFWARKPSKGNSITLVFDNDQYLDKVVVETGLDSNPSDILLNGSVEVSPKFLRRDMKRNRVTCARWHQIAKFVNGAAHAEDLQTKLKNGKTKCIRIVVGANQEDWIVFRQLAVYTAKNVTEPRNHAAKL